jgi:hypothetical protein
MKRTALIGVGLSFLMLSCSAILGDFTSGPADSGSGDAQNGSDGSKKDAASTGDSGINDARVDSAITAVDASASAVTVYINQTATLNASATTTPAGGAVTFSWTVTSAPADSTIETASLSGSDTAAVSFEPDLAGAYVLNLKASSGSADHEIDVTVTAVAPTVFYMRGDLVTDASFTSAYYASGSDGTQVHPVTCPVTAPTTSQGFLSPTPQTDQFWPPDDYTDFWEAPAGAPSRFAVAVYNADPSGNPVLFVGSADASCATPPAEVAYDGGSTQPRFAANGSRLVFLGAVDLNVVTVNPDGTDLRIVANYATGLVNSGLAYDPDPAGFNVPPRPQWVGDDVVAWVRQYTASSVAPAWEIVKASDVAGATPQRYMACPGGTPREFQFLSDGSVIVAYRTTLDASTATSGPENLYRLTPDGSQNCTVVEQYTELGNSGISQATDFAVSPDGTKIAFLEVDVAASTDDAGYASQGLPGGYPYLVAVEGGTPTQLSNDFLMYGPRWIGDGTRLLATRYDGYTDGGIVEFATSIIVRAPTTGQTPAPLLQADGYKTFASTGSNGGCSVAAGSAPPAVAWLGVLGAALARILGRSRRRDA